MWRTLQQDKAVVRRETLCNEFARYLYRYWVGSLGFNFLDSLHIFLFGQQKVKPLAGGSTAPKVYCAKESAPSLGPFLGPAHLASAGPFFHGGQDGRPRAGGSQRFLSQPQGSTSKVVFCFLFLSARPKLHIEQTLNMRFLGVAMELVETLSQPNGPAPSALGAPSGVPSLEVDVAAQRPQQGGVGLQGAGGGGGKKKWGPWANWHCLCVCVCVFVQGGRGLCVCVCFFVEATFVETAPEFVIWGCENPSSS